MKKSIIPVAAFIAGMAIVPSVFAADNGVDTSIKDIATLANCVGKGEQATCTYAGDKDLVENASYFDVKKSVTIDLGGHKLTVEKGTAKGGAFQIANGATLTITNGFIEGNIGDEIIKVNNGGSLVLNADLRAAKPIVASEPEKVVINSTVYANSTNAAVVVTGATDTFGKTASVVEINGTINGTYTQSNYVNGTINGAVSATNADAVKFNNGGTLTVKGQLTSTGNAGAIYFNGGSKASLIVKCATLTADGAALFIDGEVSNLNIENSTLTSKNGSTINGTAASKVATVTIDGSRFVAKSDKKVKDGGTNFVKATYDGRELAEDENVLSTATGSYGTLVACDAPAANEGEEEGKEDGAENPNTADTIATYLTIAAVALLGLGATAFVAKKSNR